MKNVYVCEVSHRKWHAESKLAALTLQGEKCPPSLKLRRDSRRFPLPLRAKTGGKGITLPLGIQQCTLIVDVTSAPLVLEVRGLSKAALSLQLESFAVNPRASRPTGRTRFSSPHWILNFARAKFVEVRGFEPLTFSLRTRRSTN